MIKLAIFDMDGVLIDSEPLWERTENEVYKSLGIELGEADRLRMMGRRNEDNAEYLYQQYGWQGPSLQEVVDDITERMIANIHNEGVLMAGVDNALRVCKQAGLRVAIASSSPQVLIEAVVDTLKIREHFHHIYSAQFEEYGKPHPGVFLQVARHFKVDPHDCVVFEDSPSGVLAAKSARMHCVAIPEREYRGNKFVQTADLILNSLDELTEATLKTF